MGASGVSCILCARRLGFIACCLILRDTFRKAITELDGELRHSSFPVEHGHCPFLRDVSQRQPDQLGRCLVIGEMSSRLDRLADAESKGPLIIEVKQLTWAALYDAHSKIDNSK